MAETLPVLSISPSGGIGPKSSMPCSPCTSMAGLKLPILLNGAPPPPMITANVGSTCCGVSLVFSVVNASSSVPAPTPTE
jgi:hypothetical protein